MPLSPADAIKQLLHSIGVAFHAVQHDAVFTCDEADLIDLGLVGSPAKNLLVCESGESRLTLVMLRPEQRLDLKALARRIGAKRLRFASADTLMAKLGVTPGSVSILGLSQDHGREVQLVMDQQLWESDYLLCHPLVNTETLSIAREGVRRFLDHLGCEPQVLALDELGVVPQV